MPRPASQTAITCRTSSAVAPSANRAAMCSTLPGIGTQDAGTWPHALDSRRKLTQKRYSQRSNLLGHSARPLTFRRLLGFSLRPGVDFQANQGQETGACAAGRTSLSRECLGSLDRKREGMGEEGTRTARTFLAERSQRSRELPANVRPDCSPCSCAPRPSLCLAASRRSTTFAARLVVFKPVVHKPPPSSQVSPQPRIDQFLGPVPAAVDHPGSPSNIAPRMRSSRERTSSIRKPARTPSIAQTWPECGIRQVDDLGVVQKPSFRVGPSSWLQGPRHHRQRTTAPCPTRRTGSQSASC